MSSDVTGPSCATEVLPESELQLNLPIKDKGGSASPAPLPRSLQKFYQGEPMALGITQVLTGLLEIGFGILLQQLDLKASFGSPALPMNLPIWSGTMYTISGSLSVVAAAHPVMTLVKGGLVMNICSALISGVAGIVYLVTIVFHALAYILVRCTPRRPKCDTSKHYIYALSLGIFLLFLFLNMLQFCVSISISAFGCKTLRQKDIAEEPAVLYQPVPTGDKPGISLGSSPPHTELKEV
ncbi:membrane-spanning 4-domains subfamily A member 4A-like [Ambystoma mexicanum]|uniref:membrane-spanning 4-domains subfamily A member 4A-like n=1 Tax=Ambystoma mexicanum TaxID=8296 RepID=UPI0037E74B29